MPLINNGYIPPPINRKIIYLLGLFFFLSLCEFSYANNFELFIKDKNIPHRFLRRDKANNLFMTVERFCDTANISFSYNKENNLVFLKKETRKLYIYLNKTGKNETEIILNQKRQYLKPPVITYKNEILLPIEPVSKLLGLDFDLKIEKTPSGKEKEKVSKKERPLERITPKVDKRKNPEETHKNKFRIHVGGFYFAPEIESFALEREWGLSYSIMKEVSPHFGLELKHDTYKSEKEVTLLQENVDLTTSTRNTTGYIVYLIPKNRWQFTLGLGFGIIEYSLDYSSKTDNDRYNRWFKVGNIELKTGAEYFVTEEYSIALEIRGIFGSEEIALDSLEENLVVDYSDVFVSLGHNLYF